MNKKNDNENDFIDKLDWEKYINEGIAYLKRRKPSDPYDTPTSYSIVAKGITAYLSYESTPDYDSFRMLVQDKKLAELEADIFPRYYNKCFSKLAIRNKIEHPVPSEQKSEVELIQDFIENEKHYFAESKPFYEETRYWEKDIIEEIKKAALYFPKWVKKIHLSKLWRQKSSKILDNQKTFKEQIEIALYRLELFKENDSTGKPFLKESDYNNFKKQLERFIKTGEYDKPRTKLNPCLDYNIIRFLFKQINSDLYMKSKNRIDRETRDFIKFMMDFFKFPFNWNKEYIAKHYKDPIDLLDAYKKYNQFLKS